MNERIADYVIDAQLLIAEATGPVSLPTWRAGTEKRYNLFDSSDRSPNPFPDPFYRIAANVDKADSGKREETKESRREDKNCRQG